MRQADHSFIGVPPCVCVCLRVTRFNNNPLNLKCVERKTFMSPVRLPVTRHNHPDINRFGFQMRACVPNVMLTNFWFQAGFKMTITAARLGRPQFSKKSCLSLCPTQSLYKAFQGALSPRNLRPGLQVQHSPTTRTDIKD